MAADACAAPPSELSTLLTIVVLLHLEVEISELFAINEGGSGTSLNLSNICTFQVFNNLFEGPLVF